MFVEWHSARKQPSMLVEWRSAQNQSSMISRLALSARCPRTPSRAANRTTDTNHTNRDSPAYSAHKPLAPSKHPPEPNRCIRRRTLPADELIVKSSCQHATFQETKPRNALPHRIHRQRHHQEEHNWRGKRSGSLSRSSLEG